MQDYNDNNQNRNQRRTSTGQSRAQGQSRPQGQPRQAQQRTQAAGQVRRSTQQGQPYPNRQPRPQQPYGTAQQRRPRPQQQQQYSNVKNKKKSKRNLTPQQAKKRKIRKIILFVVEIFILLILLAVLWVNSKLNKIETYDIDINDVDVNKEVQEAIDNGTSALKGYRNIALFGVDSRAGELEKNTRTDTIMVASINLDTNEVRLVSVMRDTWLNLSTDSYNKANAAYAKGGYKQAISMLNMNLDLNITDFVTVGFDGLIDAIDAVGGVEIDVKQAEIEHINNYQISMVGHESGTNSAGEPNYEADPGTYTPVTKSGLQTLNGLQATAYCRVRYVGNDFERTSRQRTVLTKLAKKAMTLNLSTLNKIADAVLPNVYTSLDKSEIISLMSGIASYSIGDNTNFPFDGYVQTGRIGSASVVVPVDLTKNVSLLHEFLFDEENYEPTETVKKCSAKIVSDSGMSYSGD